jgi:Flp pilus assembly protein TadG
VTARASFLASETGSGLVEVAVMLPVLLLLMIGTLDVGRGYYYAIEINDAAEAGALYGSQNPSDTAGMVAAATLNAPDISGGITTSAAYGCECSNGTGLVAGCAVPPGACSTSYVQYVQVNTSWTYRPLFPYPGIPSSYALAGQAILRASP